jgi:hypothetical protein
MDAHTDKDGNRSSALFDQMPKLCVSNSQFVITRGLFFKNCMAVHAKEARKRKQAKMARPRLATPPGVAALAAAAGAAAQRIVGWPLRLHSAH